MRGPKLPDASEPGVITVVQAGNELNTVHQVQLDDSIRVTPALDQSTLYIRGEKNLWAFRKWIGSSVLEPKLGGSHQAPGHFADGFSAFLCWN